MGLRHNRRDQQHANSSLHHTRVQHITDIATPPISPRGRRVVLERSNGHVGCLGSERDVRWFRRGIPIHSTPGPTVRDALHSDSGRVGQMGIKWGSQVWSGVSEQESEWVSVSAQEKETEIEVHEWWHAMSVCMCNGMSASE
jgi:hypothetical protein